MVSPSEHRCDACDRRFTDLIEAWSHVRTLNKITRPFAYETGERILMVGKYPVMVIGRCRDQFTHKNLYMLATTDATPSFVRGATMSWYDERYLPKKA